MTKTLISQEQFKVTPWKNGAGVTAEIAISPKGSDFREANFKWRISSARIEDENEFSKFPGYSRTLTVLSGEGLMLNDQEVGPFEVFEFEGEDQIECVPLSGPVEDLNVIFLRDRYRCSMQLLHVTEEKELKLESGIHFFLPLSSPVNIAGTEFEAPDFLKIEGAGTVPISAAEYPATLLKILIWEDSVVQ
jgi:environmental stress-induced protein Ves